MKTKKTDLDVDYIGGQEPLTREEEVELSTYIRQRRQKNKLQTVGNKKALEGNLP